MIFALALFGGALAAPAKDGRQILMGTGVNSNVQNDHITERTFHNSDEEIRCPPKQELAAAAPAPQECPPCHPTQIETGTSCIRKELQPSAFKHYLFEFPMPVFDGGNASAA